VVVEDNCFIGSRVVVTEGAVIEQEAVLGPGVIISASIPIIDVREGQDGQEHRGRVPARAVVVGGVRPRRWPGGESWITCNYIIGERKESTDKKTSLESALREYGIAT
jgi:2,3,4,5-tetrahydropyridine-2-carboxylate N-succinyltransferase